MPHISASLAGSPLGDGAEFTAINEVLGDNVSGNNFWWEISADSYVWSGGTTVIKLSSGGSGSGGVGGGTGSGGGSGSGTRTGGSGGGSGSGSGSGTGTGSGTGSETPPASCTTGELWQCTSPANSCGQVGNGAEHFARTAPGHPAMQ